SGKNAQAFESCGPAICLVTQGEVMIDGIAFKKGESFFIKADGSPVLFNGNYSLFAASLFSGDYNPAQEGGRAQ
ncbi:MAG: hypothetical protein FWC17_05995, partial [Treponema sp.]|nr:hypothetical protein [Treponema sp.]